MAQCLEGPGLQGCGPAARLGQNYPCPSLPRAPASGVGFHPRIPATCRGAVRQTCEKGRLCHQQACPAQSSGFGSGVWADGESAEQGFHEWRTGQSRSRQRLGAGVGVKANPRKSAPLEGLLASLPSYNLEGMEAMPSPSPQGKQRPGGQKGLCQPCLRAPDRTALRIWEGFSQGHPCP